MFPRAESFLLQVLKKHCSSVILNTFLLHYLQIIIISSEVDSYHLTCLHAFVNLCLNLESLKTSISALAYCQVSTTSRNFLSTNPGCVPDTVSTVWVLAVRALGNGDCQFIYLFIEKQEGKKY